MMASHDPIAYTYDADTHCPHCAELRFGRTPDGFIAGEDADGYMTEDSEGNPVGVIAPWDDWCSGDDEPIDSLVCGTCGGVIAEHEHEPEPADNYREDDGEPDDGWFYRDEDIYGPPVGAASPAYTNGSDA